jgi:tetratricopeptide (TPR) repeat protein
MTTTSHYDEFALFEYAEGTSEQREEIEAHLADCPVCATSIGEHRRFVAALGQPAVWENAPEPAPKSRFDDLLSINTRLQREDAAGSAIVEDALTGPTAWWRTRLRKADGWRTAGVVRQLLERVRPTIDAGSPANALRIAELAVEVANELNVTEYPSDFVFGVRAQALRDHAYALSYVGRFPEALQIADRAERLFKQTPLPEYEVARLKLVRSIIYRSLERASEAVSLTHEAADAFHRFGQHRRYIDARVFEAAMLYKLGRTKDALAIWLELEKHPEISITTHVIVLHDIGTAYQQLRKYRESAEYLLRAAAEYEMLDIKPELVRTRWMIARTYMMSKRTADAIPLLRDVWREFESLEMESDAALAALDLVEALLAAGHYEQVPVICRTLLDRFTRAGMNSPAVTALAYLREAVAAGQATRPLVRHVQKFLRELPKEPALLFMPPPDRPLA